MTVKREKFCQEWHATGNKTAAYRASYDCSTMCESTINNEAHLLSKNHEIAKRMQELQAIAVERHMVTVDSICEELETARQLGLETNQVSASVAASLGKAKLHGLLIDKQEIDIGIKNLQQRIDSKIFDGKL